MGTLRRAYYVTMEKIDKLIINSPYDVPLLYWHYDRETRTFEKREGRRPAGYVVATDGSKTFDDPGTFIEIDLVNKIRPRVDKWRESGYAGVTGITKRLLTHWRDPEERTDRRFFFCQLEAIETLIWLTEAPKAEKTGIEIPSDGGAFSRWCSKMATGSGKTIVMSMLIAWQILNKVANKQDTRFSKNILAVAPGLTVKSRLSVLNPSDKENYYVEFNIVPPGLMENLRQGKIKIVNWHMFAWDTDEKLANKKTVDKRGAKSDEAYVREALGDMGTASNIVVINDEAHHAWRVNPEIKVAMDQKEDKEEATVWVGGLDRINRARGILRCFDLSATPFAPSGKKASEEALFPWIVSDFGLNDAIESGLVKTPRIVVRDDGSVDQDLRSNLYHIYAAVINGARISDDLNQKADPAIPLPDLVKNAYILLGKDWKTVKDSWEQQGHKVPPVMITVANTTYTSARIKNSFDTDSFMLSLAGLGELGIPENTLQIDSSILGKVERGEFGEIDSNDDDTNNGNEPVEKKKTKKEQALELRAKVDTVGRAGEPGEKLQNIISVGMLSEGWDAKTVTHIMGLRAFSSQLLCEQVVGRGLRRTSYDVGDDGLFDAEYVNIFGVPFTFLPHEDAGVGPAPPPPPKTRIEPIKEKAAHELSFPNILRIDHIYKPKLTLDLEKVKVLELDPYQSITRADLAAIIAGKPNPAALTDIDLDEISEKLRMQTIVFRVASQIFNAEKKPEWKGSPEIFLMQLIGLVEQFLSSGKITIKDPLFNQDDRRRRILIMLNMNKVIQHFWNELRSENSTALTPVFDTEHPIRSTSEMRTWYTSRPSEDFEKTHINQLVVDSQMEYLEARTINDHPNVDSFVKNDHLGFAILYNHQGVVQRYFPDFLIRFTNGSHLVLETKGQDRDKDKTKRQFLDLWCKAVNQHGGFGKWSWAVSFDPNDLISILGETIRRG
jgi:type III restriction enzyme